MLKNRIIPVLFLKNGFLVRSESFRIHQNLGNPVAQVERYNTWDVDELIYIDISLTDHAHDQRSDLGGTKGDWPKGLEEVIQAVAKRCFSPLTFGGRIRCLEDIRRRIAQGADKVTINTQAISDPGFISQAAVEFGSQAIVVSIDACRHDDGTLEVFADHGTRPTGRSPKEWAREAEAMGAGEIFLNSIDRDGTANGYDLELIEGVVDATSIPLIACGGAGDWSDFARVLETGAAAAAAGNLFHFKELAYPLAKRQLRSKGLNVR